MTLSYRRFIKKIRKELTKETGKRISLREAIRIIRPEYEQSREKD